MIHEREKVTLLRQGGEVLDGKNADVSPSFSLTRDLSMRHLCWLIPQGEWLSACNYKMLDPLCPMES